MSYRIKVLRMDGQWWCEVWEPDEDGYYAKLTDREPSSTWDEAIGHALVWAYR